jgi:hypothetical protein
MSKVAVTRPLSTVTEASIEENAEVRYVGLVLCSL